MSDSRQGVLGRMQGIRRLVAIGLVAAIVYKINGGIKPGLLGQIVFWIFVIFPVYSIAMLADAIVLNVVEFWTGAGIDVSSAQGKDGTSYVLQPSADGREAVLTVSKDGKVSGVIRFVRLADGRVEVRDAQGRLAGEVLPDGSGGFRLTDANGTTVSSVSAADIASLAAAQGR
jgi:hypothetical protein